MNIPVKRMINNIREALIEIHGEDFLELSENDQNKLIWLAFCQSRAED